MHKDGRRRSPHRLRLLIASRFYGRRGVHVETSMAHAGAAVSVLIAAGIGIATNVVTDQWSWAWGSGLVALVLSAVAIQVALSLAEERGSLNRTRQSDQCVHRWRRPHHGPR